MTCTVEMSGRPGPLPADTRRACGVRADDGPLAASVQVSDLSLMLLQTAGACKRTRGFESLALRPDRRSCF